MFKCLKITDNSVTYYFTTYYLGKYLIVKDPNKSVIRLYDIPDSTFESDDDDDDDDEDIEGKSPKNYQNRQKLVKLEFPF